MRIFAKTHQNHLHLSSSLRSYFRPRRDMLSRNRRNCWRRGHVVFITLLCTKMKIEHESLGGKSSLLFSVYTCSSGNCCYQNDHRQGGHMTTRPPHCLLCTTQVKHQGNVCPQCLPRWIALGRVLIAYSDHLEPILQASPGRYIRARFVQDEQFLLKELDKPVSHGRWLITHTLSLLSPHDNRFRQRRWCGHSIPSTLVAALIDHRFPENPSLFVPLHSWHPVLPAGSQSGNDEAKQGD
jgi:hypothetical protein